MNRKLTALAFSLVIAASGVSALSADASAEWVKSGSSSYYKDDSGKKVKGWKKIGGKKYYFGNDGVMRTGWVKINGDTYYFGDDGVMRTGKVKIDGKSYTFGSDGVMKETSAKSGKSSKGSDKTKKDTSKKKKKAAEPQISVSWDDKWDKIAEKLEDKDMEYLTTQHMIFVRSDGEVTCYVFVDKEEPIDMYCTLANGSDLNAARSALALADYKLEYGKDYGGGEKRYIYANASNDLAVVYKLKLDKKDYVATMFFSPDISKDIMNDGNYDRYDEVMDAFGN